MIKKNALTLTLLVSAATALTTAAPAAALGSTTSTPMQQRVNAALAAEPGGMQTAWNEVSWDDGRIVLTLAPPALPWEVAAQVSNCASGKFCAYSAAGYGGNKLAFSTCTSNLSVSALGAPVRSIANSRTSGTVTAYNNGTYVTTVAAGTGKNILVSITSLSCS